MDKFFTLCFLGLLLVLLKLSAVPASTRPLAAGPTHILAPRAAGPVARLRRWLQQPSAAAPQGIVLLATKLTLVAPGQ